MSTKHPDINKAEYFTNDSTKGLIKSFSYSLEFTIRRIRILFRQYRNKNNRSINVVMLHAGRCGSTVLSNLLSQHSSILWTNEPFERMPASYLSISADQRHRLFIKEFMYKHQSPTWGFDVKILPEQHLSKCYADCSLDQFIKTTNELSFSHFVLLNRRNHLRRAISINIGTQTGTWYSTKPIKGQHTTRLDPDKFTSYGVSMTLLDFFRSLDEIHSMANAIIPPKQLLELFYEDDIEKNPCRAYEKTLDFLKLNHEPASVELKRQNPHPVKALLDNYDEISELLSGTKYEWMLYD